MTTGTVSIPRWASRGERRRQLAFAGLALASALVAGAAPWAIRTGMPQIVAAAALLLAVVGAHLRSRAAGLMALWALWLLAPGIRRLVGLTGPYLSADPLALLPFLATAAVAAVELTRVQLPARVRRLLTLAAIGYLIGVPVGFATAPLSAVFALMAYGAAVLALVLGFVDPAADGGRSSLLRALQLLAVPLAAYAIYQYFAGPPSWDERWLESVDFITAGAPEAGRVRVFSTLNSPGTFAAVVALVLCAHLCARRVTAWSLVGAAAGFVALALTYVRSAWTGLLAAALVYVLLTRGRGASRIAVAAVGCVLLVVGLGGVSSSTATAVSNRFGSLGALEQDKSANDRVNLRLPLIPQAASAPLGHGLGQAGEATRLGASRWLAFSDNGFIALLYQVGAVGFILVMVAVVGLCRPIFRRVWRTRGRDPTGVFLATGLALLLVMLTAGDVLYGVTGVVFWYLLGYGVRWAGVSGPGNGGGPPPAGG